MIYKERPVNQAANSTAEPELVPPGPSGLPVVGNLLQARSSSSMQRQMELWRTYGDIVHLKVGPMHIYTLYSPEYVNHVLVKNQKNYIKGIGYDGFRLLVGQGLVTSDGDLWRHQRRLMQPSFTPAAITQFSTMMVDLTHRMLVRWDAFAEQGTPLVMDAEMLRLTMSIIGQAMFGIDLGEELTEVGHALESVFGFIPGRTANPLAPPLSLPLPAHRQFRSDMQIIEAFIAERIADGHRNPDQNTLLALLLQARDEETGQPMSDKQLRDEVVTLFFAGFETTARSLTWGWYLLAKHPEVQERLADEAQQVLGGRHPQVSDLFALTYTRQVIDEVLRIYPPTALLARQNINADEIGGYPIPPKSMIVLAPYCVHRYPGIWSDPERFDPDRFSAEAAAERPKAAYIPFAAGPRVCLGNNFALQEMAYAFAMAAARFRVEIVGEREIPFEVVGTIRPLKPLRVRLHKR